MSVVALWIPVTLIASAAQVARNTMQRGLIGSIGTVGATQVRFLYGFPFAALFLAGILLVTGEGLPAPGPGFLPYLVAGAVTQVLATALMLAAMRDRSFAVVTALVKTEPVQVALFGFLVLGDRLTAPGAGGVVIATMGVVLASMRGARDLTRDGAGPVLFGLAAAALFALSSIAFRGAILGFEGGSVPVRASAALTLALGLQTAILVAWMGLFDRPALRGSLLAWRPSLLAGLLGALGSQFWFLGFALTSAANVRTLALVEVILAHAVSRRVLGQAASRREIAGMGLIVVGVALLLVSQGAVGAPTPPARAP